MPERTVDQYETIGREPLENSERGPSSPVGRWLARTLAQPDWLQRSHETGVI